MRVRTALCSAVSALSALALLSACGSGSTSASSSDGPLVGVDYPRSDTDFWNSYIKYTPQYAKELGLDLKTTNSQNDVAKLTANAQTFISQGVKGLAVAPQDTAAIAPTLAQMEAKTPGGASSPAEALGEGEESAAAGPAASPSASSA
ncbi:substrate-binding domain-containing protein, partial [Streptomyces eurythermus]